jgi:hypothetical protein
VTTIKPWLTLNWYRPCFIYFDPAEHLSIETHNAISVDGSEVLVAYRQQKDGGINRTLIKGPTLHVPSEDEWCDTNSPCSC